MPDGDVVTIGGREFRIGALYRARNPASRVRRVLLGTTPVIRGEPLVRYRSPSMSREWHREVDALTWARWAGDEVE